MDSRAEEPSPTVLFITRKWPPAIGGMETYSVRITEELAQHLTVETFTLPGRPNGLPPKALSIVGFAARALWAYLRRPVPPDVLHIGDLAAWPLGLLARLKRPYPTLILSAHGTDVSFHRRKNWKGRLYGAYLRFGAKLNSRATVIANSAATARAAAETGWVGASVVPLATDLASSGFSSAHDGNLLFAGRLVERKGCLWFVQNVLPLLPENMCLKIAGPIWDKAEEAVLQNPRVSYLGSLNQDALIDAYRTSLCVIVPNIDPPSGEFEGFGLVAVEAPAAGGIAISSATGGLIEAVIDGETGFLVPAGDPQAWHHKIMEIVGWDESERQEFLSHAMARSREVYSWRRVAGDVLSIYRDASFSGQN